MSINTATQTLHQIADDLDIMLCEAGGLIDRVTVRDDRDQIICHAGTHKITIRIYRHEPRPLVNCRHLIDATIALHKPNALPLDYDTTVQVADASELVLVAVIEGLAYEAQAVA